MISENPRTIVRKRSGFDYWILQFWENSKEESSLPRKGLAGESMEKEIAKKVKIHYATIQESRPEPKFDKKTNSVYPKLSEIPDIHT